MKERLKEFIIFITYLVLILSSSTYTNFLNSYSSLLNILSIGITIFIIALYILKRQYSKFVIIYLIYIIFGYISCMCGFYSSTSIFVDTYMKITSIILLTDLLLKNDCKITLKILKIIFLIIIFINTITIILFPNGLYETNLYTNNWFLQYDNLHIFIFMPAMLISIISDKLEYNKISISTLFLLLMITFSVYYCFSANTVVAYTLFLIYIIFYKYINKIKVFNSVTYFIVYIVTFLFFSLLQLQNSISTFIVNILNKNLTFSGRTALWNTIIYYIKKKPILGYGIETNKIFTAKMGSIFFTHAHNTIFDILYKGGMVSLCIFMYLILLVIKELNKFKNNNLSKLVSFSLLCCFLMMNFESRQEKIGLWIILCIGYNIKNIINISNKEGVINE